MSSMKVKTSVFAHRIHAGFGIYISLAKTKTLDNSSHYAFPIIKRGRKIWIMNAL